MNCHVHGTDEIPVNVFQYIMAKFEIVTIQISSTTSTARHHFMSVICGFVSEFKYEFLPLLGHQ